MAYSLPHNISLQQLTELQEGTTSAAPATPPASSSRFSMDPDQASLRHMLTKTRDSQQQVDNNKPGGTDEDEDDEQDVEEGAAAGVPDSHGEDVVSKPAEDNGPPAATNSSLLVVASTSGTGTASTKLRGPQDPTSAAANPSAGPTWLSNAMLRQAAASAGASAPSYNQWLQVSSDLGDATLAAETQQQQQQPHSQGGSVDVNNDTPGGLNVKGFLELHAADTTNSGGSGGGGGGGGGAGEMVEQQQQQQQQDVDAAQAAMDSKLWQSARLKADLVTHPLYEQLLSAHISCLRTATPVDQLPKIDAQLAHSAQVAAKYSMLANTDPASFTKDKDEVNEFMAHYVTLLRSFKEQLQQHVRVHAMEAVVACWELEQSLFTLTGVSPGEGSGATMSEDEDEQADSDSGYFDTSGMDGHDFTGFGPLIPTETERTLMERVRHELKIELKQGYKAKINDVREEILRKRRAGKLPGDTTSVLKSWWHAHSKWPYPSEDDKARLVQETGLELKQINNWFINQRKRNWHSNPSSSTSLKNKRKR